MIASWFHTRELSWQMLTSVLHRDVVDRPEEALVDLCMDEENNVEVRKANNKLR